jgi:hypothetical protein
VRQTAGKGLAFLLTAADRVWKGYPHKECERGLDKVVQAEPCPLDVRLVEGKDVPENTVRIGPSNVCKT